LDFIYTQSGKIYDKIPNAPQPTFTVPPPPQSSKDSHVGDGVNSYSSTQTTGRPSSKNLVVSNQTTNALETTLTSETNGMSSDKDKNPKQLGRNKKGRKKRNKKIPL